VAPLRLGGLRGKQSTPSDWLGGTGEVSTVGEWERHRASGIASFEAGVRRSQVRKCVCLFKNKRKLFKVVYESLW
jgi:hypothetical protein